MTAEKISVQSTVCGLYCSCISGMFLIPPTYVRDMKMQSMEHQIKLLYLSEIKFLSILKEQHT